MSSMTLNGSQDTQNWLHSPVQTFFTTCNWDDQSLEVQSIKFSALIDTPTELTLRLSVNAFFAAVNWDGSSTSAPVAPSEPSNSEAIAATDAFTLTDFSDLF